MRQEIFFVKRRAGACFRPLHY